MKSASPTETPPLGKNHVGLRRCILECLFQCGGIVAHHAHVDQVDAQPRQCAVKRVAVAVVDFARRQRASDGGNFVAGGKERHAQAAAHRHFADTE